MFIVYKANDRFDMMVINSDEPFSKSLLNRPNPKWKREWQSK